MKQFSPPSWFLPDSAATDESLYFNRRALLKAAGLATTSLALPSLSFAQPGDPLASKTNPKFQQLEPTAEKLTTSYNNFYEFSTQKQEVKELCAGVTLPPWQVEITGLAQKPLTLDLDQIKALGLEQRVYRLRCVEAWSMIVPWDGVPLAKLIQLANPTSKAKYVAFVSLEDKKLFPGQRTSYYPWPYAEGLTLPEAMHELSFLAFGCYGKELPIQNGAPLRLVVPWKYGFKSIKSIVRITLTDHQPATLWNQIQPKEYGFYANVNPAIDHPRWSQSSERVLGSWFQRRPTELFNGYPEVAPLYRGLDLKHNF